MVLKLKLLEERHHVGHESIFLIHLFASVFPCILHLSEVSAQENVLRVAGDPVFGLLLHLRIAIVVIIELLLILDSKTLHILELLLVADAAI